MEKIKICEVCKEPFKAKNAKSKFCSPSCRLIHSRIYATKWREKNRLPSTQKRKTPIQFSCVCAICGKGFFGGASTAKYCSKECRNQGHKEAVVRSRNRYMVSEKTKSQTKPTIKIGKTLDELTPNQLLRYGELQRQKQIEAMKMGVRK